MDGLREKGKMKGEGVYVARFRNQSAEFRGQGPGFGGQKCRGKDQGFGFGGQRCKVQGKADF